MKSINSIITKIKYENIENFISKAKFDFSFLNMSNAFTLYTNNTEGSYIYIGNLDKSLYFLKANLTITYTLLPAGHTYHFELIPNKYYVTSNYYPDKEFLTKIIRTKTFLEFDSNSKQLVNSFENCTLYFHFSAEDLNMYLVNHF